MELLSSVYCWESHPWRGPAGRIGTDRINQFTHFKDVIILTAVFRRFKLTKKSIDLCP